MIYLSRLQRSLDPSLAALNSLLDPDAPGDRTDAHHRLIWSAFAGVPGAKRDFLWREDGNGVFIVQSPRPPSHSPFFDPPEVQEHAPNLRQGDKLTFLLRANATKDLKRPDRRSERVDVVMELLHDIPKNARCSMRPKLAQEAALRWMERQGLNAGFAVDKVEVQDYTTMALPGRKGGRKGQPRFGILDLSGQIRVQDPDSFTQKLFSGFGRAKGFGCGLMLIRRA